MPGPAVISLDNVALVNLTPFAWALYMCDQNVKTWIQSSPTKPGARRRRESEAARKAGEGEGSDVICLLYK